MFAPPGSEEEKAALAKPAPPATSPGSDLHQTVYVGATSNRPAARFEKDGESHVFKGLVFTIGRSPVAHLRIRGLFVGDVHARVLRDAQGRHILTHVEGWRAMTVNGVRTREAVLEDGDVFAIAGQTIVFRHPPAAGAGSASIGAVTGIGPRK